MNPEYCGREAFVPTCVAMSEKRDRSGEEVLRRPAVLIDAEGGRLGEVQILLGATRAGCYAGGAAPPPRARTVFAIIFISSRVQIN